MISSRSSSRVLSGAAICGLAFIAACGGESEGSSASYSGKTLGALTESETGDFCADLVTLVGSTLDQVETLLVQLPCEVSGLQEPNAQACIAVRDACVASGGEAAIAMELSAEDLTVESCREELEIEQCDLTADQVFRCFRDLPAMFQDTFGGLTCDIAGDQQAIAAAAMQFGDFDETQALPASCTVLEESCFATSVEMN